MGDKPNTPGEEPEKIDPATVAPENPPAAPEAPAPDTEKDKEKWQEPKPQSSRKNSYLKTTLEGLQAGLDEVKGLLTAAPKSSTPEPGAPKQSKEPEPAQSQAPEAKPPGAGEDPPAAEKAAPENRRKNRRWI